MSCYRTICQYVCPRCSSPAQEMNYSPKAKGHRRTDQEGHCTLLATVLLPNETVVAEESHILSFSLEMKYICLAAMSTGWVNLDGSGPAGEVLICSCLFPTK